jgi:hypothetical protein
MAGVTTTAVLDPEKLLWVPGERKIFIPKTEIKLATAAEMDWLARTNTIAFQLAWSDERDLVDRTLSPFWKQYYMKKQGLVE